VERVVVMLEGQPLEFDLDWTTHTWTPVESATRSLLQESEFPLIGHAAGKRYELYSDGSFGEVEL
jgi:hypothetical protein